MIEYLKPKGGKGHKGKQNVTKRERSHVTGNGSGGSKTKTGDVDGGMIEYLHKSKAIKKE